MDSRKQSKLSRKQYKRSRGIINDLDYIKRQLAGEILTHSEGVPKYDKVRK